MKKFLGTASLLVLLLHLLSPAAFADRNGRVSVIVPIIRLHVLPTAESATEGLASKGQQYAIDLESGSFYRIVRANGSASWISKEAVAVVRPIGSPDDSSSEIAQKRPAAADQVAATPAATSSAEGAAPVAKKPGESAIVSAPPSTAPVPTFAAGPTAATKVPTVTQRVPAIAAAAAKTPPSPRPVASDKANRHESVATAAAPLVATVKPAASPATQPAQVETPAASRPKTVGPDSAPAAQGPTVPVQVSGSGGTNAAAPAGQIRSAPANEASKIMQGDELRLAVAIAAATLLAAAALLLFLRKRKRMDQPLSFPKGKSSAFEGEIAGGNLPDILQFISDTRKTGCLQVENTTPLGIIYFALGRITHAAAANRVTGIEAIHRILGQKEGKFRFLLNRLPKARDLDLSALEVLMEWSKAEDEAHRH